MSPILRQCIEPVGDGRLCGVLTADGNRCPQHRKHLEKRVRDRKSYLYDPRWSRLKKELIPAWVRLHGGLCPGYNQPSHQVPISQLTLDHITPPGKGGDPFDRANVQVLCRDCNGRKAHHLPKE